MQETGTGTALVSATRDGLLIVASGARPGSRDTTPGGGRLVRIDGQEARLVFCAASLLDPVSGRAGTACLADAATLTPGPEAFVGRGHAQVFATLSDTGGATCPTSLAVGGTVTSPAGDRFALHAGLVLARTERGCTAVSDAVDLAYRSASDVLASDAETSFPSELDEFEAKLEQELRRLADLDPARWELIDTLVRLGDEDWQLLRWMLSLDGAQLAQLGRFMDSGGAPEAWGNLTLPGKDGREGDEIALPAGIVQDIYGRVGTLLNRVGFSLPNDGPVRNLFKRIDVSVVVDLLTNVKEQIGGVLGMIDEIRAGYDDWSSDSCGPDCGLTDFKGRLSGLFSDLDGLWCDAQHLACLDNPDLIEPRHLRGFRPGELFQTLLIEKPPAILLYALQRVLDNIDDWDSAIANVRDGLPEALSQLCSGCRGCDCAGGETASASAVSNLAAVDGVPTPHEIVVCEALRPDSVGEAVENTIRLAGLAMFVFDVVQAWTPDNKTYGVEITAVGGGGATLTIKNPPNGLAQSVNKVLKLFKDGMEQVKSARDACVKAEKEIEAQLAGCNPPRELFTQVLAFDDLARMQYWAERWIGEALLNPDVHDEIDLSAAQCFVERSFDVSKGRRARFTDLCDAYQLLVAGTVRQDACGVAPPETGGGGPRRGPRS